MNVAVTDSDTPGHAHSQGALSALIFIFFLNSLFFVSFSLFFGVPANMYDSVVTECLPAAETGALQQLSPRSTPAPPREPPAPPRGASCSTPGAPCSSCSFYRTGLPVLTLLLLRQSPRQSISLSLCPSLSLSHARITLARVGRCV